jgi:hypothetical protein
VDQSNPLIGAAPQSSRLATLANALEDKALELEVASVPHHGWAHVDDVTDTMPLVAAILRHPSNGPSAAEILAWAAAVDKDSRFGSLQRSLRVTWRDGVIDYQDSFITVPAFAPPGPISIYTNQQLPAPVATASSGIPNRRPSPSYT